MESELDCVFSDFGKWKDSIFPSISVTAVADQSILLSNVPTESILGNID